MVEVKAVSIDIQEQRKDDDAAARSREDLGDYPAHESPVLDGSVLVADFTSARTELEPGAGGTPL